MKATHEIGIANREEVYADLDALAEQLETRYTEQSRADALKIKQVLTDPVPCRIVEVKDAFPPAKCEIITDLGEKLPAFTMLVRSLAELLKGKRVYLTIRMSGTGHRYVVDMLAAPRPRPNQAPLHSCANCQKWARLTADGTHYECPSCAFRMEMAE